MQAEFRAARRVHGQVESGFEAWAICVYMLTCSSSVGEVS